MPLLRRTPVRARHATELPSLLSMSKKARMSMSADGEKQALWLKHSRALCDELAGSLEKKGGAGYKHVTFHRDKGRYRAVVLDIDTGKHVYLGYFNSSYAAAVTAALSKEKGASRTSGTQHSPSIACSPRRRRSSPRQRA